MACLVQQLFRLKIGKELDPSIVDVVLFPLLFKQKHGPKELLQDIKLTQSCNEHGLSAIVGRRQYVGGRARHKNISPFAESCLMRRQRRTDMWGSIDILNELRGLNYPRAGYKPRSYVIEEPVDYEDGFISLAEDNALPATIRWGVDHSRENAVLIDGRSQFVKNFLDDVLITGKRLTWGAQVRDPVGGILSIVESSQHG